MAIQAFELLRNVESPSDNGLTVALGLQPWLALDGTREADRSGGVLRYQFAELVDLPKRHFQYPPHVAQHTARLKRAKGNDLSDPIAAITALHVSDHLITPILAEVDVEIGH